MARKIPSNCSAITVGGSALTPAAQKITPPTVAANNEMSHPLFAPKLIKAAANGAVTLKVAATVTSITIGGVAYTPNAAKEIVVPAAPATQFLAESKYLL